MKISSKTRYALKTVLDLAQHRNNGVCRVTEIAARQGIPQKFLEQILLALKSSGLVMSKRGARGGYYIAKQPAEISIADVIRVTEESLLTVPLSEAGSDDGNPFGSIWKELNTHVVERLKGVSFKQVCDIAEQARQAKVGDYAI